ncbi:hypothetical protein [Elioraea sp.]|uniref:hypothetical protein n=1 Tax=Elioraea sp. TaxID=2185103 RepID=UPI0025C0B2B0|nr:hypothetical protein [Elioraea sp.]
MLQEPGGREIVLRDAGYRRMELRTHAALVPAWRPNEEAGFCCVASEEEQHFGPTLVSETWARAL